MVPARPSAVFAGPKVGQAVPEEVLERPDEMSALVTARMTGKKVKIAGLTSETSEFWALPEGRIQAEVHAGPVRIKDDQGAWKAVDFTLAVQPDGTVAARSHPFGLRLSGAAASGEQALVTLGRGDLESSLVWDGALPAPAVEGTRATYGEVRPGVDLVVEATRTGFEQFLVVKNRDAVRQVRSATLGLRSKSLRFDQDGAGGLTIKDAKGTEVGISPAPVMWDAQVGEVPGLPLRHRPVTATTKATAAGGAAITLSPDEAWLNDPATRYPVTIDPAVTLGPAFDTYVGTSFTTDQSAVSELAIGTGDGGANVTRSFLSFHSMDWLWGKGVVEAKLYLWNFYSRTCQARGWEAWKTAYASSAIRWTSQPAWRGTAPVGTSSTSRGSSGCAPGWVDIPVTGAFADQASSAIDYTVNIGLRATSETDSASWKGFHSLENVNDPYVVLTYQSVPTVTSRASVPSMTCATGNDRPIVGTTTPQLRAQATDAESSPVTAKFEWAVAGSSVFGSATVGPGASGSWLATSVPVGAFSNGGSYAWRVQAHDGTNWGPWSGWCEFTVDTSAPGAAPTVTSATYPERSPTPTGYISSTETRPYVAGSTVVALTGDDARAAVALPFPFTFYGQQYTSGWIDTNGQLSFADAGTWYNACAPLPTGTAPNAVIYAFCDDLYVDASAGVYTATSGTAPNRQYVVEWRNVIRNASRSKPVQERVNISLVLSEDGEIAVNYGGIDPDPEEEGGNALIGVENATGTLAEQYSYKTRVLANGKAVVFRPGVLPFASYTKTTAAQPYTSAAVGLALTGDNEVEQVTLPYPFAYYGQVYTSVWVDTNGQVYFTDPLGSHNDAQCVPIPNTALPNGGISPYCDNLKLDAQSQVRIGVTGVAPNRNFIIEWWNARHYNDAAQRVNVTATLGENGTITFNYSGLDTPAEQGLTALVGIEHKAGTSGIQHSYHSSVLTNNGAIIFTPEYGQATSTGGAGVADTFTFGPSGVTDVASYQYGLNTNPPATVANAVSVGGTGTASIAPDADGPQTLYVRSQDRAGNQSPIRAYPFFAGPGGLTSPKPGDITAAKFALTAEGHPASTGATYQWRRGDVDVWATIPAGHVTYATGGTVLAGWPIPTTGSGKFAKLNWDVEATLAASDPELIARDGPLQVRVIFSGLTNGAAQPVKVTFDRNQASAASQDIGPGSVNLITGNYTLSDSDVSVDSYGTDLTVTRTFNTRRAAETDKANMFGPGWVSAAIVDEANAPYTNLTKRDSLVQVGLPDGETIGFTQRTATEFDSETGMEFTRLTYASGTDSYTLSDQDGNTVAFTRIAGSPADTYHPTAVTVPGSNQTTTISWEKVTVAGTDLYRPTRMLAPVPDGVNCATMTRGCRAMNFTYATSTTATGTTEATWGDYTGRVKEISFTAWDPDLATPAMRTIVMARYAYDNTGRLRSVWDPRLDWTDGTGVHHLADTYSYDADGVITTVTPSGQEPWQLAYTTIPGDPGKGRFKAATRTALTAGTATNTVVYKVPTTGTGAPYDLSGTQTRRWGQYEPPTDATAVFPANQVPTGNQATGTLPSSWERASVTYLDANARTVNSASPGGYLSTTWYDRFGNTIRSLTAGNRKRALDASGTDSAEAETVLAGDKSTLNLYSSDGKRLLTTLGPEHDVVLPNGTTVHGRGLTRNTYDEGAPSTGAPFDLVTTSATGVRYRDANGVEADADMRRTTTAYDWGLRQPTLSTFGFGGLSVNKAATGSASCVLTEGPEKAVNGSVNGGIVDKWCSLTSSPWLQVDLGSAQQITSIVIRHVGAGGETAAFNTRDFTIQLSTDGTTWSTPVTVTGNTASVTTHTITATTARYVKLNITTPTQNGDPAARIYEFEVYGPETGTPLETRTAYDPITGLATSATAPAGGATTNTPATRRTVYYRATSGSGYSECDLKPEWANLACRTQPGGQAATGPELPATVTTYDIFNQPRIVTEKISTGTLRTTTTTYDSAGRKYEETVTAAAGLGAAVPIERNVYDQATGQLLRTQSVVGGTVAAQLIRAYDTLGRQTSYTDADNNTSTITYDLLGRTATSSDGKAARTYTYDGGTERRGLLTSVDDTQAGVFSGNHDADGTLISETWPNGIVATTTADETGTATGMTYAKPGCGASDCTLYNESMTESAHGQWREHSSALSKQTYRYDQNGRLTSIADTVGDQCTTRTYRFSASANRTAQADYAPAGDGSCQTTTAAATRTWTYDTADRVNTTGYTYDTLGRTTTVPAVDTATPIAGNTTATYHVTDLVDTITQNGRTTDYTLDVNTERIRTWTDNASGSAVQSTHHYDGDDDNPVWTQDKADLYTRPVTGVSGMAAIWNSDSGQLNWHITNLHGDLVAAIHANDQGLSSTSEATEYGTPRNPADTGTQRYGWLGAKQRAADTPSGVILMGVRLYNTVTGRFLQTDPVVGGSCNAYEYTCADPINSFDLDGRSCRTWKWLARASCRPAGSYREAAHAHVALAWWIVPGGTAFKAGRYGFRLAKLPMRWKRYVTKKSWNNCRSSWKKCLKGGAGQVVPSVWAATIGGDLDNASTAGRFWGDRSHDSGARVRNGLCSRLNSWTRGMSRSSCSSVQYRRSWRW